MGVRTSRGFSETNKPKVPENRPENKSTRPGGKKYKKIETLVNLYYGDKKKLTDSEIKMVEQYLMRPNK